MVLTTRPPRLFLHRMLRTLSKVIFYFWCLCRLTQIPCRQAFSFKNSHSSSDVAHRSEDAFTCVPTHVLAAAPGHAFKRILRSWENRCCKVVLWAAFVALPRIVGRRGGECRTNPKKTLPCSRGLTPEATHWKSEPHGLDKNHIPNR